MVDRLGVLNAALYFDGTATVTLPTPFASGDTDFTIALWMVSEIVSDGSWHGFCGHQAQGTRSPSLWVNNGAFHQNTMNFHFYLLHVNSPR